MNKLSTTTVLVAGAALCIGIATLPAQSPTYQGIPSGFDFPGDEATLLKARDSDDVSSMRRHAWMVFAGLTQPAPGGEAIWETWYTGGTTFSSGPQPQGANHQRRQFQAPRQFKNAVRGAQPQDIGISLLSFTLFNQEARDHIRSNGYHLTEVLDSQNEQFPANTPVEARQILDFPREAVVLKTLWWVVKQTGMTAMPIWDPATNPGLPGGNDINTWNRVVAVDPSRTTIPAGETASPVFMGKPRPGSRVVPLNGMYAFQITANELDSVRSSPAPNAATAQIGDHVALVALHYTTKEIPQWVWSTFWWHDEPSTGPFGSDRPASVSGVWQNYLMATTYSMDRPKEADGGPAVCFNPWLEARFVDGVKSNCMSCHQLAVWQPGSFLPVSRGSLPANDPLFQGRMKLDFLWSIAFESR